MMAELCYQGNLSYSSMNNKASIFAEGKSLEALYYHYTEYISNQTTTGRPGKGLSLHMCRSEHAF